MREAAEPGRPKMAEKAENGGGAVLSPKLVIKGGASCLHEMQDLG